MNIARFLCTCCGDCVPDWIILWAGVEKWMLLTMSLCLGWRYGCDHMSVILFASLQSGMGSRGTSKMSSSGPCPCSLTSRYAVRILRHCSCEGGAHVRIGDVMFLSALQMTLGGLLSLVYNSRDSSMLATCMD